MALYLSYKTAVRMMNEVNEYMTKAQKMTCTSEFSQLLGPGNNYRIEGRRITVMVYLDMFQSKTGKPRQVFLEATLG